MIKLFVIEDHEAIIVSGLRNMFRPSRDQIEVTGSAPNVNSALSNPALSFAGMIILDLWIPGEDPLASMTLLKKQCPGKPVLIYTSEELPVWQHKMMAAGVSGYISKNCSREDLKSAIRHVAKGGTWFTGLTPDQEPEPGPELSPVEKQILNLLINGYHHHEIASKLNTTSAKIDKSLVGMRTRFQCKTTVELVILLSGKAII